MPIETLGNGTRVVNSTRIVLRADGRPKYIIGVVEDVTDRKAAEAPYWQSMISSRICRTARLCRSTWRSRWEKPALPGNPSRCCGLISTVFKEANDLFG
jgi:hypothetical protein